MMANDGDSPKPCYYLRSSALSHHNTRTVVPGRFTEPPSTPRRRYHLPSTQAYQLDKIKNLRDWVRLWQRTPPLRQVRYPLRDPPASSAGGLNSLSPSVGKEGRVMSLRVVTWNVQWATPTSRRTTEILSRIGSICPRRRLSHRDARPTAVSKWAHYLLSGRLRVHNQGRSAEGYALVEGTLGASR